MAPKQFQASVVLMPRDPRKETMVLFFRSHQQNPEDDSYWPNWVICTSSDQSPLSRERQHILHSRAKMSLTRAHALSWGGKGSPKEIQLPFTKIKG